MDLTSGETNLDGLVLTGTDGDIVGVDMDIGQWLLRVILALLLFHSEGLQGGVSPTVLGQGVPAATTRGHRGPIKGVVLQGWGACAGAQVVMAAGGRTLVQVTALLRAALHLPARVCGFISDRELNSIVDYIIDMSKNIYIYIYIFCMVLYLICNYILVFLYYL